MKRYQRYFILSCSLIAFVVSCVFGGTSTAAAQSQRRRPPGNSPQVPHRAPSQPQQQSSLQIGLGAGLDIPVDDTDDLLDLSASVHGTLLGQVVNSPIKLEGDLGYWFLQAADENDGGDDDPSLLTLTGGIRYYLNSSLHLDGGLGLYRFSDWESMGYDEQNELGIYSGLGLEQAPLDFTFRIHHSDFYDEDDFWNLGISVRVFFM